jgi:hypothetical protein
MFVFPARVLWPRIDTWGSGGFCRSYRRGAQTHRHHTVEGGHPSGCTTALDGSHDPQMRKRQSMILWILIAIVTEDVPQFAPPVLRCRPLGDGQQRASVEGISDAAISLLVS